MTAAVSLERRLASYRRGIATRLLGGPNQGDVEHGSDRAQTATPAWDIRRSTLGAERLAATLDGELVRTSRGAFVRLEAPSTFLPLDRTRLANLPGQPPPGSPLLCLDTETTGLATAAGTLAFLVGLGWWESSRFRQVQLLLPDHADEPAILDELARHVPATGWLVTYNGRGFDWPLIVARYRLARNAPPPHAGHLDLLPIVRRLFRHRLGDARLATVEAAVLGVRRHADVAGWEIPERYFTFLRDGEPGPLVDIVRHNDEDVRSLARLLVHLDREYADPARRRLRPPGDLAGLARALAREGRHEEALGCIEASLTGLRAAGVAGIAEPPEAYGTARAAGESPTPIARQVDEPWWSPRHRPDFGGHPGRYGRPASWASVDPARRDAAWTVARATAERARLLRRLGRHRDAEGAWLELTAHGGSLAVLAWIEVAKAREHRLGDLEGALAASELAARALDRQRGLGHPLPRVELALSRRSLRLRHRLALARAGRPARSGRPTRPPGGASPRGSGRRPARVPRR